MHGELCANVVVSDNCGEFSVRGAHHNENDAVIGIFERHGVDVFAVSCGSNSLSTALNKLGEMSNVVVNGGENKLFCFGVVENGRVAACRLVLKYDACNRGGTCRTVVEGAAFFAQEQIPVAKSSGKVVKVANKLFAVSLDRKSVV